MKQSKLKPLGTKVLVRPADAEATSKGGIIIPENAREKQARGEVLAVGAGRVLENGTVVPPGVSADDVVLYSKYAGTEGICWRW